jgi:hypothetical protein
VWASDVHTAGNDGVISLEGRPLTHTSDVFDPTALVESAPEPKTLTGQSDSCDGCHTVSESCLE